MAHALITLEKGLYARQANNKMWTPWRVIEKNLGAWALRDQMTNDVAGIESAKLQRWLEEPTDGFRQGFMSPEGLDIPSNVSLSVRGPDVWLAGAAA